MISSLHYLAKYGKCPAYPKPEANCPPDGKDECALDEDCAGPEQVCCTGGCDKRTCTTRVRSKFTDKRLNLKLTFHQCFSSFFSLMLFCFAVNLISPKRLGFF